MRIFKSKKNYYLFELDGKPRLFRANTLQEAVNDIAWIWLFRQEMKIVFVYASDGELIGKHLFEPQGGLFDHRFKATPHNQ